MSNAEPTPTQRGPYKGRNADLSYEERLERRRVPRPECKCGCGTLTRWLPGKARWAAYAKGHYRRQAPYKDAEWLRNAYISERRTTWEIAAECGVGHGVILKAMRRLGIERRNRSDARRGRRVGAENHAWKGGIAQWEYSSDWKAIAHDVRNRGGWTCRDCGERRARWGHALHVHHIDGNKLNNDLSNLVSLCATCHRIAHTREEVI